MNTVIIHATRFDSAICEVIRETPRAYLLKNTYNKTHAWIPKSALNSYRPGSPTYENEFSIKLWFYERLNDAQSRLLNLTS